MSSIVYIDSGGEMHLFSSGKFFSAFEGKITYVEAYIVSILLSNLPIAMAE